MQNSFAMIGVQRPLPVMEEWSRFYWEAGASGHLRFASCNGCGALLHPPPPVCRYCRSTDLGQRAVEGGGVLVGVTVNHHRWDLRFPPPYVIATIAIDEDPRVRIISNVVGDRADEARVGMRVKVRFEHRDDVWMPLFELTDEPVSALPVDETPPEDHRRWVPAFRGSEHLEDRVALTGIGMSDIGRRLMRPPLSLTVEAITNAVVDAGLTLEDVDGLCTYPVTGAADGFAEGGTWAVEDVLGIRPTWHNGGPETFGRAGTVISAMLAVATGLARHVVCFRTVWQATYAAQQRRSHGPDVNPYGTSSNSARVPGFSGPYGVGSAANNLAMYASHHFHKYGTTRETLGWVALNQRRNASLNPKAIYRDPLTMDEYLEARMITTPFGLYDCDVPVDACVAVVVSALDTVGDLRHPPVLVEAIGTQITERITWEESTMTHEPQVLGPSAHLWTRTSLRPQDVDVALLYDGFSFNCVSWLEALGFCDIGEAKSFLDGGRNIALEGGVVALNPHGGQLSAGRTHGMGFVHEAVSQLRGSAAAQVRDASVAVVSSGGLTPAGVMLLRKA